MNSLNLKEAFTVETKHSPLFLGGNVEWSQDGDYILCQNGGKIEVVSVNTGTVKQRLGLTENDEDEDIVNSFTLSDDCTIVVSHHKSSLFKMWSPLDGKLLKVWKSIHLGPIPKIALTSNNEIMASGGIDSSVRIWDLKNQACVLNLKGVMEGVTSVLKFYPIIEKSLVFASGIDTKIHCWNYTTRELEKSFDGHFSQVTDLSFHDDGIHMVSSGRDKVLILWNIIKGVSIKILPVFEPIESTFIIPSGVIFPNLNEKKKDCIYAACSGENGTVDIWELTKGAKVYSPEKKESPIKQLIYNSKLKAFCLTTNDHNIIIYSIENFECLKQFIGNNDEILDVIYVGDNGTHIAVATNSPDIKLYELSTMSSQLLKGHDNIVLSLATTPANLNLMASSGKDNAIRIWLMCQKTKKMSCIATGMSHTMSIASIAFSQASTTFLTSVSQDQCLKFWDLPSKISINNSDLSLEATSTVLAHKKDINFVTVSPNDKLIATASQDKTAKLWDKNGLKLLGVFSGHRRGVWCVKFSPIDQVLLTSSADCTMRLWSIENLSCLKTFEGHESSIHCAEFMSRGMQIITSSKDGLIKIWNIKTSECVTTLDAHEKCVYALALSSNEDKLISGGRDSFLIIWRDVTQENRDKLDAEHRELILEEQKLANLLKSQNLIAALKLALKLEKPFKVLKIIENIIKNGDKNIHESIQELKPHYKDSLLRCATAWNMNGKNSHIAQLVINELLKEIGSGDFEASGLATTLETLIPYTDRHYSRISKLLQDLHLLDYTSMRIKPHS